MSKVTIREGRLIDACFTFLTDDRGTGIPALFLIKLKRAKAVSCWEAESETARRLMSVRLASCLMVGSADPSSKLVINSARSASVLVVHICFLKLRSMFERLRIIVK